MAARVHPGNNYIMSLATVAVETSVFETTTTAERRQNLRHRVGCDATVTVFGMGDPVFEAVLNNVGEGGAQLTLDRSVAPSSLVKIEYSDNFLLGEVVYCRKENSAWLVGVKLEHGLFGLTALASAIRESWK
jgi:PilZ domain